MELGEILVHCISQFKSLGRMSDIELCLDSTQIYDFERSGWINGLKELNLDMKSKFARVPPQNLTFI